MPTRPPPEQHEPGRAARRRADLAWAIALLVLLPILLAVIAAIVDPLTIAGDRP